MVAESYQNIETSKVTVDIESELYRRVKNKLHYGQMSKLLRNIFESLDMLIQNDELGDIIFYIYKKNDLHLIPDEQNSDGRNPSCI